MDVLLFCIPAQTPPEKRNGHRAKIRALTPPRLRRKSAGNAGILFSLIGHFRGCFFP